MSPLGLRSALFTLTGLKGKLASSKNCLCLEGWNLEKHTKLEVKSSATLLKSLVKLRQDPRQRNIHQMPIHKHSPSTTNKVYVGATKIVVLCL